MQVTNLHKAEPFRLSGCGIGSYAFLAATLLSAAPAFAQGGGRKIDIRAVNTIDYNDNVVLNDPRISGGGTRGDVSTSPSLSLDIVLPRATGSTYVNGTIGYRFFKNYTRLNRENISLNGGVDQRLASCLTHGEVGYTRALGELSDLLATDTPQSFRNTQESRRFSADISCGSYGLRPSLAYSRYETRNDSTLRQFGDSNSDSLTAQLGLAVPAIGTISVFGRGTDTRYIHRLTPTGRQDGSKSYAVGVQLERSLGTRLNFSGSVNYTKVDPKLAGTRSFSGIGYQLSATYSGDDYSVQLAGSRSSEPSAIYFVSYNITTTISASVSKQLSNRMSLGVNAGRTWRDFAASSLFLNAPVSGSDESFNLGANISYSAIRRLRFSLGTTYSERTSNIQLFPYKATRVYFTTSLAL